MCILNYFIKSELTVCILSFATFLSIFIFLKKYIVNRGFTILPTHLHQVTQNPTHPHPLTPSQTQSHPPIKML